MHGIELLHCIVVYSTILLVCYNWNKWLYEIPSKPKGFIYATATQDLSMVGEYSSILTNYIYNWIYMLMVTIYRTADCMDIYDIVISWNKDYNVDMHYYIIDGIEKARTKFLSEVKDKTFVCPIDYDYTVVSRTIEYNDYVDHEALIRIIREELKRK